MKRKTIGFLALCMVLLCVLVACAPAENTVGDESRTGAPADEQILVDDDLWSFSVLGKDRVYGRPYYTLRIRNKSPWKLSLFIKGQIRYDDIKSLDIQTDSRFLGTGGLGATYLMELPVGADLTCYMTIQASRLEISTLEDLRMVDLWCEISYSDSEDERIQRNYGHFHLDWDDSVTLDDLLTPLSLITPRELSDDPSLISIQALGTYRWINGEEAILCQVTNRSKWKLSVGAAGSFKDDTTNFSFEPSVNGQHGVPGSRVLESNGTFRYEDLRPGETAAMLVTYHGDRGRDITGITDASFMLMVHTPTEKKSVYHTLGRYVCNLHFDPVSATPTPEPTATLPPDKLPKNVTRLPNGNLRYDDGMIAFEYPSEIYIYSVKEQGETIVVLLADPFDDWLGEVQYYSSELDKNISCITLLNLKLSPAGASELADKQIKGWKEFEERYENRRNLYERSYLTVAGRTAARYQVISPAQVGRTESYYLIPAFSGVLWVDMKEYPNNDLSAAAQLFLSTLEIRDPEGGQALAEQVPSDTPASGEEATPAPTAEPAPVSAETPVPVEEAFPTEIHVPEELSSLDGFWMTRDDSWAELIISNLGSGSLNARALFLPAADFDLEITMRADGGMVFESTYGHLKGTLDRQEDGALRLTVTGGYIMEDEEATEYQGYFDRTFVYYPAEYEEMWYQTPLEPEATAEDWIGDWIAIGADSPCSLAIRREGDGLRVDTVLGPYRFSCKADEAEGSITIPYDEGFSCVLKLNKKLGRIAMMEVGASAEEVYDLVGNPYYGVMIFRRQEASTTIPESLQGGIGEPVPTAILSEPEETGGEQAEGSGSLLPIPGETGCMQVPVSQVEATSYIVGKDPTAYTPERMIDGDESTAFQFSTKTTKLGKENLYFTFASPVTLDQLWIKNGFWKESDGKDMYQRNSRVKKMTIFIRHEGSGDYQELMAVTLKDDGWRNGWKKIELSGQMAVTGVRIRIDAKYAGSKYKNDVCISEIMFVQAVEP